MRAFPHGVERAFAVADGTHPSPHKTNAHVGDAFRMQLVPPYPGNHTSLAGGVLYGHVSEVRGGRERRKAQLKLSFDRLELPNGERSPISATVQKLDKTPANTTARKALGAGAGAAVGIHTIGRLHGGTLGSVVGLVGGAAGGYLYGNNDKPNFNVATGSQGYAHHNVAGTRRATPSALKYLGRSIGLDARTAQWAPANATHCGRRGSISNRSSRVGTAVAALTTSRYVASNRHRRRTSSLSNTRHYSTREKRTSRRSLQAFPFGREGSPPAVGPALWDRP